MRRILTVTICAAMAVAALASPARANSFDFSFSSGTLAADAQFNLTGTTLTVKLINTGGDALVPTDVLTNVLFSCSGCGTLTAVSALTSGATYVGANPISPIGTNVGGEWALVQSGTSIQIASSGANGAGDGNFNGPNLAGPPGVTGAVDGLQYGIVSDNDNTATGNSPILTTELTHHDVDFVLTCSITCTGGTISNVVFQYGTSNTEPSFGGGTGTGTATGQNLVPEPTSLLLFGSGLAATAYRARRKKNQKDSEPSV